MPEPTSTTTPAAPAAPAPTDTAQLLERMALLERQLADAVARAPAATIAAPPAERCKATSTDGHRCRLVEGHATQVRPGVFARPGTMRHLTMDGATFATPIAGDGSIPRAFTIEAEPEERKRAQKSLGDELAKVYAGAQ